MEAMVRLHGPSVITKAAIRARIPKIVVVGPPQEKEGELAMSIARFRATSGLPKLALVQCILVATMEKILITNLTRLFRDLNTSKTAYIEAETRGSRSTKAGYRKLAPADRAQADTKRKKSIRGYIPVNPTAEPVREDIEDDQAAIDAVRTRRNSTEDESVDEDNNKPEPKLEIKPQVKRQRLEAQGFELPKGNENSKGKVHPNAVYHDDIRAELVAQAPPELYHHLPASGTDELDVTTFYEPHKAWGFGNDAPIFTQRKITGVANPDIRANIMQTLSAEAAEAFGRVASQTNDIKKESGSDADRRSLIDVVKEEDTEGLPSLSSSSGINPQAHDQETQPNLEDRTKVS
ncbi:MAG: hypothetical protein Q9199_000353 [Rusavskia elegans]